MAIQTLKRIDKPIKVYKILAFDTETCDNNKEFTLGSIYAERNHHQTFYNKEDMIKSLLETDNKTYVCASNLEFDFNTLFYGHKLFHEFKPIMTNSTLLAMIYTKPNNQRVTLIDTYNFYRASVETYGKILDIPKMDKPKNIGQKPTNAEEWEYLRQYNLKDSEITYGIMTLLQQGFNDSGCEMRLTAASTAMDLWRRKYIPHPIKSETQIFETINTNIFRAYTGGRTEIFKRGYIRNANYGDYNSMYPSVMIEEYPNPNTAKYAQFPHRDVLEYEGVAYVIIETPEMDIPLLPTIHNKLLFCTGRIKGVYTHNELREAEIAGYRIRQIFWSVYYRKTFHPFREFVKDVYRKRNELKAEGNPMQIVQKLLLNSLYGKFAQKHMDETQFIDLESTEGHKIFMETVDRDVRLHLNRENSGYMITPKTCTSSFVRPIFSVYTSSMAKVKLWKDLIKYDGIYCDTDSIITKKEIRGSNLLGEMKVEARIRKGIFIKPKAYTYEDTKGNIVCRLKGFPHATEEIINSILKNKSITYNKFSKMKESIKKGFMPNTPLKVTKKMDLEDTKRIWTQRFNPYIMDDYSRPYKVKM